MNVAPRFAFSLEECVAFDVECFPGRWLVGFYWPASDGSFKTYAVDGAVSRLETALRDLARKSKILVGYNSIGYDLPILQCILDGDDPYELTERIIANGKLPFGERERLGLWRLREIDVDHIDLSPRLASKGRFPSLKVVAANLGRPKLQELPYPPGTALTDEQWAEVASYNRIDLEHTWSLLEYMAPELDGQTALSNEFGLDLRSSSKAGTVKRIFLKLYREAHDGEDPPNPDRPVEVVYLARDGVVRPRTPGAAEWHDLVVGLPFPVSPDGPPKAVVPKPHFRLGDVEFRTGKGGLHSKDKPGFYRTDDGWELWDVDVASYYPALLDKKEIFPAHFGAIGLEAYRGILRKRLDLKAAMKAAGSDDERRRLDVAQDALKVVLNSTFGQFGEQYSPLADQAAMLAVTLTGQLMLVDLVERLQDAGAEILSANTDGVLFRVRRGDGRWREAIDLWQRDTDLTLETNPLECLLIVATNNYASRDLKGEVKRKGANLKNKVTPQAKSDAVVVGDAIVRAFFDDVLPEVTIGAETSFLKFCAVTRAGTTSGDDVAIDDDLEDGEVGRESTLGRITRWYWATRSRVRLLHRDPEGAERTPAKARNVRIVPDITGDRIPDDLDRAAYVREARKIIRKVPNPYHLDPKFLPEGSLARGAFDRGLMPFPKDGKHLPKGTRIKVLTEDPTFLYAWHLYPTVGAINGPKWGVLLLDVDEPTKFAPVISGSDLGDCLVSCRGEATPEGVRAGRDCGKLIFRFEAGPDHPLASCSASMFKKKYGFDLFYGKEIPSVLGAGPDGTAYVLDGELGPPPTWLLEVIIPAARAAAEKKAEAAARRAAKKAAAEADSREQDPDAVKAYAEGAVEGEIANLEAAGDGERNRALFNAACSLHEHVNGGALDGDLVNDLLRKAAREKGLADEEIERTIANGRAQVEGKARDYSHVGRRPAEPDEAEPGPDVEGLIAKAKAFEKFSDVLGDKDFLAACSRLGAADLTRVASALEETLGRKFKSRDFKKVVAAARQKEVRDRPDDPGRPRVEIKTEIHETVEDAVAALGGHPGVFQRTTSPPMLVELVRVAKPPRKIRKAEGTPEIVTLSNPRVLEELSRCAEFGQWVADRESGEEVWSPTRPPNDVVAMVADRKRWPGVRTLHAVVECPTLRDDGSIVQVPGYDADSGLMYLPHTKFPEIRDDPTLEDAKAAVATILHVVKDFPFADVSHAYAWLAAFLTPFARNMIDGIIPTFLIDASTAGSGKSLLCDVISVAATGREMPRSSYTHDEDEMKKVLLSVAIAGFPMLLFDNITTGARIGGSAIDRTITARRIRERLLGVNKIVEAEWTTGIYITGNNVKIKGDMRRRLVNCRLQPTQARPEERDDFEVKELLEYVGKIRARLVVAAITILRAYLVAGRPPRKLKPMDFPQWCKAVRDPIHWATGFDPCATRDELSADDETEAFGIAVVAGWEKICLDLKKPAITAAAAVAAMTSNKEYVDLRQTFLDHANDGGPLNSKRIGNWIRDIKDRVFDLDGRRKKLVRVYQDSTDKAVRWGVRNA